MRTVLVTGPGGSGVSTVAAAHALAAAERGQEVALACLDDDGTLEALVDGAPRRPLAVDLCAPGRWDALDQFVADGLQRAGAEGLAAEELRCLPTWGVARAVLRLAEVGLGADLLVLDAGPLGRAADLLDTAARLPWIVRRCLGAQAAVSRACADAAQELGRTADRASAGADLVTGSRARLDVVLPPTAAGRVTVRRTVPGLVLSGITPGLLVHAGSTAPTEPQANAEAGDPAGVEGPAGLSRSAQPDVAAGAWAPLRPVRCADWPDPWEVPTAAHVANLGAQLARQARAAQVEARADDERPAGIVLRGDAESLVWRVPLPWVEPQDVRVSRRADDLLVEVHGRGYLVPLPAVVRRGTLGDAIVDGRCLRVEVTLPERSWGHGR